jgi:hypothetical protein
VQDAASAPEVELRNPLPKSMSFLAMLALTALATIAAQESGDAVRASSGSIPAAWNGTFRGELVVEDGRSEAQRAPMAIEIEAAEDGAPRPFRIVYGAEGKGQVRDYRLLPNDSPGAARGGPFVPLVMDERNGILIDHVLVDDTLYSQFEVGDSRITTRFRLRGDELEVEMITFAVTADRDTRLDADSSFLVRSYGMKAVQRATLRRET